MKKFLTARAKAIAWIAVGMVAVISAWYIASNGEPALGAYAVGRANVTLAIDEPATVAAENNATISFQESGRITSVYVNDGQAVDAGTPLATLDAATLEAGVRQANAALAEAQAKLDALEAGATTQTIAVSQASLAAAEQSLAVSYAAVPNTLDDAYAKANDAVRTQLASFFSSPETTNPQLTFTITGSQVLNNIENTRVSASAELNAWQAELAGISGSSSPAALSAALADAATHLATVQDLMNLSLTALTDETGLVASTAAAYKTSATTGLTEVNEATTEVTSAAQAIASEKVAVAEAQAGLNLTTASSTPQAIAEQEAAVAQAEASASAAQVALSEASLVAPFPGTVQNVTAQVGEVVAGGAPVMTLVNSNGLKLETYVSELDVAKVKVGDTASVTLDAFGVSSTFPSTVTAVDSAETLVAGVPSYLVTLHFTELEPQVRVGMTGDVRIKLAEDSNVIAVPSRLVLNNGNENLVLLRTAAGIVRQPVTVGLVGMGGMTEIISGIKAGDELVNF